MAQNDKNTSKTEARSERLKEFGQDYLYDEKTGHKIRLITIIGEIEGHELLPSTAKTTKYEHILPQLAGLQEDAEADGLLVLLNTVGGDIEAGLAIAELIGSLTKPTVSLVLGGSHSIGVPIAVSTNYSFIVPSGTMVVHPVRMTGLVIGCPPTYEYFQQMQDRIVGFITSHCEVKPERIEELMMNRGILTKDLGTVLVGKQAVEEKIINEVGGISDALQKLHSLIHDMK